MLYLDLEDLKHSKCDRGFIYFLNGEIESHTPFIQSLLGASVPHWSRIQCLAHNAKQRAEGYPKSDPGGDHRYVGTCMNGSSTLYSVLDLLSVDK